MKQKTNARQKREAEARRRKGVFSPPREEPAPAEPAVQAAPKPAFKPVIYPDQSPEEAARELLEYLDRHGTAAAKEDASGKARKKSAASGTLPVLNLEEGMPFVKDAVSRMRMGLQEMRVSRVKAVKLIHGYGSTGRGGKIRDGVRAELASMKARKQIRDFIPGEDFGPADAASRRLAEQGGSVTRDPDYGRMNHGITVVVL